MHLRQSAIYPEPEAFPLYSVMKVTGRQAPAAQRNCDKDDFMGAYPSEGKQGNGQLEGRRRAW